MRGWRKAHWLQMVLSLDALEFFFANAIDVGCFLAQACHPTKCGALRSEGNYGGVAFWGLTLASRHLQTLELRLATSTRCHSVQGLRATSNFLVRLPPARHDLLGCSSLVPPGASPCHSPQSRFTVA